MVNIRTPEKKNSKTVDALTSGYVCDTITQQRFRPLQIRCSGKPKSRLIAEHVIIDTSTG